VSIPLIGVTTTRIRHQADYPFISAGESYVQALSQAGGCPVLIPLGLSEQALEGLFARLDGILFTGGGDIAPTYYGAISHPKIYGVEAQRDQLEFYLLNAVVARGTPFFGICRGFQVVNVGLGGTLYADIAEQKPQASKHDYFPDWPRDHLAHTVTVREDSRLIKILGASFLKVNSLHHQGVEKLAGGVQAVAHAEDGLVEAIELPEHPFGLAVQWHPENLTAHAPMRALFRAFVEAATLSSL
jgi:putative glutamine amidotransferase